MHLFFYITFTWRTDLDNVQSPLRNINCFFVLLNLYLQCIQFACLLTRCLSKSHSVCPRTCLHFQVSATPLHHSVNNQATRELEQSGSGCTYAVLSLLQVSCCRLATDIWEYAPHVQTHWTPLKTSNFMFLPDPLVSVTPLQPLT